MVKLWWITLFVTACSPGEAQQTKALMQSSLDCHVKLVTIADKPEPCPDRQREVALVAATDPDCVRVYGDAGPNLLCVKGDAGGR